MIVLDSNLWVFGTLGTNDRAESLLREIETGERTSALSAYMLREILTAFERVPELSPRERDELQTAFCVRLSRMTGLIDAPSSRDASEGLLAERRSTLRHVPQSV